MAKTQETFIKQASAPTPHGLAGLINGWTGTWFLLTAASMGVYCALTTHLLEGPEYWWWVLWLGPPLVVFPLFYGAMLLYFHDKRQTAEPVQRVFPVLYWGRKLITEVGPLFRQYLFASDREETPYNRITRNWVYQTSRGRRNTIGFGSQVDMDQVGSVIVLPKTFTNKAAHTGEEIGHSYRKVIGQRPGVEAVVLNHFIHISAMSFGALSANAHMALNKGAKKAGILHNCGEGGMAPCHEQGGDLVFQIGTGKFGVRDDNGNMDEGALRQLAQHPQVKLFEVKLAQGAKPGKGGMLLKEKITAEIARIRKVPMGKDVHSPPRHKEFNDVNGLFDFIDRVRGIVKKPVGIKMVIGHTEEIESIAKKMRDEPGRGPDYIAIDGGEGGTGAAPLVLASHAGLPMKQALAVAHWALKEYGVRDKVVLFAGGKIATPVDIAVAMALGADACYCARGFMLALGCIQALECHTNTCPTGIATQDPKLAAALDVDSAAERVATYAKELYHETQTLAEACGYDSPDQLLPDDIMVVTKPGHLDYLSELQGVSAFEASVERRKAAALQMSVGEMKIKRAKGAGTSSEIAVPQLSPSDSAPPAAKPGGS